MKEDPVEFLEGVMREYNLIDSRGAIILKNGRIVVVNSQFGQIREYWILYNENKRLAKKILRGTIFCNGEVCIDIKEICFMADLTENPRLKFLGIT